jgi:hypothetical protein
MTLGNAVDVALKKLNVEYSAKRESNRLHPLVAAWLIPESGEAYKQFCLQQGQREGQFKTVALSYRKSFGFDFLPWMERSDS